MAEPLRICYLGSYDREHVRNCVMITGLERLGVQVIEVHEQVWEDTAQRVSAARRGLLQPGLWWRLARAYARLAWRYTRCPRHNLVIVGHPGQLDLPLARALSKLRRVPLAFDSLVTLYDTIVEDRRLLSPDSLSARALLWLEKLLYRWPDRVLTDTEAQARFLQTRYGVRDERLRRVWVGAPDDLPTPPSPGARTPGPFRVVYFGKFIPLHGLEVVLRAAHLLCGHADIRFELMGDGQTHAQMCALARELALDNVVFAPEWLPLETLAGRVAGAGACLGVFGPSAKAQRVIPTKAYLALAWGLPLVTGDSAGVTELLTHGRHALLCDPLDPRSLADAILRLYQDPALASRLARQGRALYEQHCTPAAIGAAIRDIAHELVR